MHSRPPVSIVSVFPEYDNDYDCDIILRKIGHLRNGLEGSNGGANPPPCMGFPSGFVHTANPCFLSRLFTVETHNMSPSDTDSGIISVSEP